MPRIHDRETADCSSVQASEFGNFQETWDWIECESKSFPGKLYFFNLRSLCSTWTRPVASSVQLHRFKDSSRINSNSATCDVENNLSLIISSESEKEDENCNEDEGIAENCSTENNNRVEAKIYESVDSAFAMSDCLQIKLHTPKNQIINVPINKRPIAKKNLSSKKKSVVYPSSDGEKENDDVRNREVVKPFLNPRRPPPWKRTQKKKMIQKIVCEMYGTKTVSYDDVEPELPPGVKSSKLSDSSPNSSLWQAEESKAISWNNLKIPNVNTNVDLSSNSSESSKSYSSGCSCDHCSASSKMNDASSNSTSSSEKNI